MVSLINTSNLKFKIKTLISVGCVRKAILNNNIDFVTSDKCNLETPQKGFYSEPNKCTNYGDCTCNNFTKKHLVSL